MSKGRFEANMLVAEAERFNGDLSDAEVEGQLDSIFGSFMSLAREMGFEDDYQLQEQS